ncbi:unnamed protein product, partial [Symbiodinium microadriaticum]
MLNSRVFEEPSVQEIYPGRLLHVRAVHKPSYLSVDVLGLYQHVNRTHLSSELNRSYRNQIWEAIDQALNSFPARNPLLLGGDFNAQLTAQRPHVGTTCCQPGEGQARGNAKRATPNYTFPVKAWSVAGHWPVEAEVPVAPFHRRAQQQPSCPNLRFDKIALLPAVQTNNDQAQALQSTVHQELAKIESTELHQVRNSINSALLEAVEKHFPQPKPDDNRLSAQGGFRASAKHTWQLYKEMKAAHTVTAHSVFRQWQATVTFMKASQALRAQSRHLKKASVLHKLAEAETAACKGDQRVLYQIVRSLTPHKHQFLSRLRDSQGRLLDKTASLQAMLQYARDTFSVHADDPAELSMTAGLAITDQAVQQELQKLGAAKAVPFNTAPASVWKYCAGSIAGLLGPALRQHFQDLPQYAYAKSRGTFDAILRVHMHFEANLTALLQQQEMQAVMVQPSNEDTPPDSATGVMTDPSQGLNPEADIFAFCSPTLLQSKQTRTQQPPEGTRSRGGFERGERIHTAAQEAAPRAKSVDGLPPVSNLKSSTTAPDAKGSEPLSGGKTHGKVDALSRGSTGGAADGQGLRPLHATGLCQHHPQPPRHFGGVARQERGGSRKPHLLAAHSAASMFGQGIARQGPENGLDPGGTRKTSTYKVDGPRSTVDFSSMVSQNQEARGRRQQAKPEPHGAGATAHILAGEPPRRRDSQVSQHQRPGSGGGKCIQPSIRDLFAGHLPSRRTSSRDARGSVQAAGLLSMAADRSLPEKGGSSESTSGQAIGQDALRQ